MYNDLRAEAEAQIVNELAGDFCEKLGYRFPPAFALPKILWLREHEPDVFQYTHKFAHAADFIIGQLTGQTGISDTSNALKTGYDLVGGRWPAFIESKLGIPLAKLPHVVDPGKEVGRVSAEAAAATGLPADLPVVAGCTDGMASFLASGAVKPGDWNSNLGTTIAIRGVSKDLIHDPQGRIYCHKHPDGHWLPGGASNVGGECLQRRFQGVDYPQMDGRARALTPTAVVLYPLVRTGERLPFVSSNAEGFVCGSPTSQNELYAGYLEGIALVERWCFDEASALGTLVGEVIAATGGGSRSDVWMQIRANVLQRSLRRPKVAEAAMGGAILAANVGFGFGIAEAVVRMVQVGAEVVPDASLADIYGEKLLQLQQECKNRGYL